MPRERPDDKVLAAMPDKRPGITKRGLERKLGLTRQTVWRVVQRLHSGGLCHIGGWSRLKSGGPFNPRYVAGPGIDVECALEPIPQAEMMLRWKEKAVQDGRYAARAERIRKKYARDKVAPSLWFAALKF